MALIAYRMWPTWEGHTAQQKFARLVATHSQYVTCLLHQFAHPDQSEPARLRNLQAAARRARTDAEASTARLANEPPHPPLTPAVAHAFVAAVTRLAHAELALHALLLQQASVDGRQDGRTGEQTWRLDALSSALGTTLNSLSEALETLRPPGGHPPLRQLQITLRDQPPALDSRYVTITDSLVDATDTLTAAVRRHIGR